MDASKIPLVTQDKNALDLAAKYVPIILADEREPFTLVCAGYTIFDQEGDSPSFKPDRRVEWGSVGYSAVRAIEYALWWDGFPRASHGGWKKFRIGGDDASS